MKVIAQWSGDYPSLCHGEWAITIDGVALEGLGDDHFNTLNVYESWRFVDGYDVVWDEESDGLNVRKWVEWIKETDHNNLMTALKQANIEATDAVLALIYMEVWRYDFRNLSCGGCI